MSALPNDRVPQPANQSWLVARQGQRAKSSPPWNTGMWSPAEIEQLKSNVARYCQHHAIEEPSQVIFGRSKEERSGFYKEIAVGINRPLFSVYRKVLRMYDNRNYLGRYSMQEVEKLKTLRSLHGNNWQMIGSVLGRSSGSVKDRCRLLAGKGCRRGTWSKQEEEALAQAVKLQVGEESSHSNISWPAVAGAVGSRSEKQCRAKWLHYLSWKRTSGVLWTKADDLQLICRLSIFGSSEESGLDWCVLSQSWPAARSSPWLRNKWWALKHRLGSAQALSLRDNCKMLYQAMPLSVIKNTVIDVPLCLANNNNSNNNNSCLLGEDPKHPSPQDQSKLSIPAANFASIILSPDDSDRDIHDRLQKLIDSAANDTSPSKKSHDPPKKSHNPPQILQTDPPKIYYPSSPQLFITPPSSPFNGHSMVTTLPYGRADRASSEAKEGLGSPSFGGPLGEVFLIHEGEQMLHMEGLQHSLAPSRIVVVSSDPDFDSLKEDKADHSSLLSISEDPVLTVTEELLEQ